MGSSQVMGPRGASTGDLELPAPSIIPVAYVLYSNKKDIFSKRHTKKRVGCGPRDEAGRSSALLLKRQEVAWAKS